MLTLSPVLSSALALPDMLIRNAIQTVQDYPLLTAVTSGAIATTFYRRQFPEINRPTPSFGLTLPIPIVNAFEQTVYHPLRPMLPALTPLLSIPIYIRSYRVLPQSLFWSIFTLHGVTSMCLAKLLWQRHGNPPVHITDLACVAFQPYFVYLNILAIYSNKPPSKISLYSTYLFFNASQFLFNDLLLTIPRVITSQQATVDLYTAHYYFNVIREMSMQTINYSFLSGLLQQQDFTAFYLAIAMGAIQELLKRANYNSTPILSQPSLLQSAYWLPLLAILPSLREDFRINHPNDFFQSVNNSLVEMIYFTLNATLLLSTAAHVNTYAMQLRNRLTRTRQSITTRLHNYKTLTLCLGMFFLGYLSTRSNNHGLQQV